MVADSVVSRALPGLSVLRRGTQQQPIAGSRKESRWAGIRSVEPLGAPGALIWPCVLVRPEMACEVICPLVDALANVADVVGGGGGEGGGGDGGGGGGGWRRRLGPPHPLLRRRVLGLGLVLRIGREDGRQQQVGTSSVAQDVDAILLRHGQSHRRGRAVVPKTRRRTGSSRFPGGGGGSRQVDEGVAARAALLLFASPIQGSCARQDLPQAAQRFNRGPHPQREPGCTGHPKHNSFAAICNGSMPSPFLLLR